MTNFCPLVTNNLELTTKGEATPCCISSKRFTINGEKANAHYHTITEILNDSDRNNWIKNFDEYYETDCKQCYEVEKTGGESKRQREIKLWTKNFRYKKNSLQAIDLKMGNTCNLACAICGSHSSSKWGSIDKSFGIEYKPYNKWQDEDRFWEDLNNHVEDLNRVELAGGEPFMIKKQKILLQFLVDKDIAKNIEITWFTNCTMWPKELIDYFKYFKLVRIMLSIDNTKEQFEFQRYPAKWNETYQTFKKFMHLRDEGLCQVEISHSISALNIFHLPEFHQWCNKHNVKIFNNLVMHPFCVKDLPEEFKTVVKEKFDKHDIEDIQINPVVGKDNWLTKFMDMPGDVNTFKTRLEYPKQTRPGLFEKAFPELMEYVC